MERHVAKGCINPLCLEPTQVYICTSCRLAAAIGLSSGAALAGLVALLAGLFGK